MHDVHLYYRLSEELDLLLCIVVSLSDFHINVNILDNYQ